MSAFILQSAVVIDSTNNSIVYNDGSDHTVTLTTGTYYVLGDSSSDDLVGELNNKLSTPGFYFTVSTSGPLYISNLAGGTRTLKFSSSATTFDDAVIGGDGSDIAVTTGYIHTMDAIGKARWAAQEQVQSDSYDITSRAASVDVSRDAIPHYYQIGDERTERAILTGYETKSSIFTDLAAWWLYTQGKHFFYHTDDEDTEYMLADDTAKGIEPVRYNPGVALYAVTLRFVGAA